MAFDPADREHVPDDRHTELAQGAVRDRTQRDAGCLARSNARSRVRVVESVLQHSGQVGVAGSRHGADRLAVLRNHAAVLDRDPYRRARSRALPNAAHDLDAIALDLHSRSAPHTALATLRVAVDGSRQERHSAGIPSRIPRPGPWDSPAVRKRSRWPVIPTFGATSRATAQKSSS